MPTLYVCFLENDQEIMERHWLNRVAAMLSSSARAKIHVELFFPEANHGEIVSGKACSIHYGGKVFLAKKNFSRKQWSFRTVNMSSEQYKRIKMFCEAHVGNSFNYLGYYLQPFQLPITPYHPTTFGFQPRWFCSEICIEALKAGSVLGENTNASMHPHELFEALQDGTTADTVRNYDKLDIQF